MSTWLHLPACLCFGVHAASSRESSAARWRLQPLRAWVSVNRCSRGVSSKRKPQRGLLPVKCMYTRPQSSTSSRQPVGPSADMQTKDLPIRAAATTTTTKATTATDAAVTCFPATVQTDCETHPQPLPPLHSRRVGAAVLRYSSSSSNN